MVVMGRESVFKFEQEDARAGRERDRRACALSCLTCGVCLVCVTALCAGDEKVGTWTASVKINLLDLFNSTPLRRVRRRPNRGARAVWSHNTCNHISSLLPSSPTHPPFYDSPPLQALLRSEAHALPGLLRRRRGRRGRGGGGAHGGGGVPALVTPRADHVVGVGD